MGVCKVDTVGYSVGGKCRGRRYSGVKGREREEEEVKSGGESG
jgi:hypothetical protein